MSILIAEDNVVQRRFLSEILANEFPGHAPIIETDNGAEAIEIALAARPSLCIFDIQMPVFSGVKVAKAIWREYPQARIIFWTQFPDEVYIHEIRKIIRTLQPQPAYGFIHKNNTESKLVRFVGTVLEDGSDMIDPAFKDAFKRPLLTEFENEALKYLALGLSNWAIARKCSLTMRGVESRLTTLYEKLFITPPTGSGQEEYDKLAFNARTRGLCEALRRGLINLDELESAEKDVKPWIEADRQRFREEQAK